MNNNSTGNSRDHSAGPSSPMSDSSPRSLNTSTSNINSASSKPNNVAAQNNQPPILSRDRNERRRQLREFYNLNNNNNGNMATSSTVHEDGGVGTNTATTVSSTASSSSKDVSMRGKYAAQQPPSSPVNQRHAGTNSMDSRDFRVQEYIDHTLSESTLNQLLQFQSELIMGTKQLDGDMKTLVYENYEKFISANDTIKKMKLNVESMEVEMSRLDSKVGTVGEMASRLDRAFYAQVDQLKRLNTAIEQQQN